MPNAWFRMYAEFRNDAKVRTMPEAVQLRLVWLFCLQCEGSLPLGDEELKFALACDDDVTFHETKDLLLAKGFIDENWALRNWSKRQFISDSSTARTKKYRANKDRERIATSQKRHGDGSVTPPDTDTDTDTYTEQKLEQKPSRAKQPREVKSDGAPEVIPPAKTKTQVADERHQQFKSAILHYWESKNEGIEMSWGPAEGKQLGMWLKENPKTTVEQFTQWLRNRFRSDVNHTDRPARWISTATSFANGPIDRYGKPIRGGNNGKRNSDAKADYNHQALEEALGGRGADYGCVDGDGGQEGCEGSGRLPASNGSCVIEGELVASPSGAGEDWPF